MSGIRAGGGVPAYVRQVLVEARRRGVSHALACGPSSRLYRWTKDDPCGSELFALGDNMTRDAFRSMVRLRSIVSREQPDVVHLHSSEAGVIGRLALAGMSVPVVFQPHAWSFLAFEGKKKRAAVALEQLLEKSRAHVLCGSIDEAEIGAQHKIGTDSVIANAIDLDRFQPIDPAERASLTQTLTGTVPDPLVVMVGRLVPQKAPEVLLDVWQNVSHKLGPRPMLALVGDGPQRSELEARGDESVLFVGEVDQTLQWHQIADVSILTSRYETLSLSMLESLACSTPVVVTRTGGVSQVLQGPNPPGRIAEIGDREGIAEALVDICQRASDLRPLARDYAVPYGLDPWSDQLFGLYRQLAGGS